MLGFFLFKRAANGCALFLGHFHKALALTGVLAFTGVAGSFTGAVAFTSCDAIACNIAFMS